MPARTEPKLSAAFLAIARSRWRQLRYPIGWGAGAIVAVSAVLLVANTQSGADQLQRALTNAPAPPEPQAVAALPARTADADETRKLADETRNLAEAVRRLSAERDQLTTRVAGIEHNLDDITGSIKSVMQANAAAQSVKEPPKEKAAAAVAPPPPAPESAPMTTAPEQAAATAPPPSVAQAETSLGQPTEIVPLPPASPTRMASIDQPQEPPKPEYGIDLGSATTLDMARSEWARVKANYGPMLTGLRPVASPRQHGPGGIDYRLVVGPFPTMLAASRLCAKFNAARISCRTTRFIGDDITQQ